MSADVKVLFYLVLGVLGIQESLSEYCTYTTIYGVKQHFTCYAPEVCCLSSCCHYSGHYIYNLWYFWFCLVLFLVIVSSGGFGCYRRWKIRHNVQVNTLPATNVVYTDGQTRRTTVRMAPITTSVTSSTVSGPQPPPYAIATGAQNYPPTYPGPINPGYPTSYHSVQFGNSGSNLTFHNSSFNGYVHAQPGYGAQVQYTTLHL